MGQGFKNDINILVDCILPNLKKGMQIDWPLRVVSVVRPKVERKRSLRGEASSLSGGPLVNTSHGVTSSSSSAATGKSSRLFTFYQPTIMAA